MRLDPNPLFRRIIIPWYDSPFVCWIVLSAMLVLFIFSLTGILVAENNPDYHGFLWVPVMLLVLCLILVFSVSFRLLRVRRQHKE